MPKKPDQCDGEDICEAIMDTNRKVDQLLTAFPAGDLDGHRRYHEVQIQRLEETRRLRVAIQEKTISGLIWAGVVWVAYSAFHSVAEYIKGMH